MIYVRVGMSVSGIGARVRDETRASRLLSDTIGKKMKTLVTFHLWNTRSPFGGSIKEKHVKTMTTHHLIIYLHCCYVCGSKTSFHFGESLFRNWLGSPLSRC